MNAATHGIEIQTIKFNHNYQPSIKVALKEKGGREKSSLEISVWDFAGQNEYYHNHHYFLSTRSVFLVLWKMSDAEKVNFLNKKWQ